MSTAQIKNADEVVCILQLEMKLKDWKQIRKTLQTNSAYTELQIIYEISDLIHQLEQTFYNKE